MKILRVIVLMFWAVALSGAAHADVTKTVTSPEVEIPRIHARSYDFRIGITYSDPGMDGSKGVGPIFEIGKHKVKPSEGHKGILGVQVPMNATVTKVRGLVRNEPWGGSRKPPKPNTDDLGSVDYKGCPMGHGDCPIAWADVSSYSDTVNPEGKRLITAVFRNWAGRNDRTAMLEVTYTTPE